MPDHTTAVCTPSDADVIIVLKSPPLASPTNFLVNSRVLLHTSPFLRILLDPQSRFAEGQAFAASRAAGEKYHLQLEEDDPVALEIVLRAMHHQLRAMLDSVGVPALVELALVCDKYDCTEVLYGCVERWFPECLEVVQAEGNESALFVAWVFGLREWFGELALRTVVRLQGDGRSLGSFVARGMACSCRKHRGELITLFEWKHVDGNLPETVMCA